MWLTKDGLVLNSRKESHVANGIVVLISVV